MPSLSGSRPEILALLAIELTLAVAFGSLAILGHEPWGFACLGVLMSLLTHLPLLDRRRPYFSIWGMTSMAVTLGAGVRGVLIGAGYPSRSFVDSFFLGGNTFNDLFAPGMVALSSIAALTVGFLLVKPASDASPSLTTRWRLGGDSRSSRLVVATAAVYLLVGTTSTWLYSRAVGGTSAGIAERRGIVFADGTTSGTFGYLEFGSKASVVGALLLLAYWTAHRKRLGVLRACALALAFLDAFLINWITTTRSDLVYVAAAALTVRVIFRGRVSTSMFVAFTLVILAGIGTLSAVRAGDVARPSSDFAVTYGLQSGLLNRNEFDLGKTMRVVDAVPEVLPYQNGATITRFLVAPVPRSVWPEKPVISPGPEIGRKLYGTANTGVPPGLTGELVWNFGVPVTVVLSALFGIGLAKLERFRPRDAPSVIATLVYAFVFLTVGRSVVGISVGHAAVAVVGNLLLLAPLLLALRARASTGAQPADAHHRDSSRHVAV